MYNFTLKRFDIVQTTVSTMDMKLHYGVFLTFGAMGASFNPTEARALAQALNTAADDAEKRIPQPPSVAVVEESP